MNKQELAIAKKIAEIEGVAVIINEAIAKQQLAYNNFMLNHCTSAVSSPTVQSFESIYNPFDWSILGPLMLKYKIGIAHLFHEVLIPSFNGIEPVTVKFENESDIPRAILECIIKSQEA